MLNTNCWDSARSDCSSEPAAGWHAHSPSTGSTDPLKVRPLPLARVGEAARPGHGLLLVRQPTKPLGHPSSDSLQRHCPHRITPSLPLSGLLGSSQRESSLSPHSFSLSPCCCLHEHCPGSGGDSSQRFCLSNTTASFKACIHTKMKGLQTKGSNVRSKRRREKRVSKRFPQSEKKEGAGRRGTGKGTWEIRGRISHKHDPRQAKKTSLPPV